MEINKISGPAMDFIKKYRFVVLILLLGVVLMLIPGGDKSDNVDMAAPVTEEAQISLTQELENILSNLQGAGRVKVMVTMRQGKQTLYQTDMELDGGQDTGSQRVQTVLISQSDKSQTGLVSRVDPPKYLGVIVMCQGADNAGVKLSIVDAVAKITGLGADSISVLKMK